MNKTKNNQFIVNLNDIPLIEYSNIFVSNLIWLEQELSNTIATFDVVIRELPQNWNFFVFNGSDRLQQFLLNWRFDKDAINVLKKMGLIDSSIIENYYKNFRFSGDIWTLKEGTIFFPGEPIIRITAPLLEANLLTAFLINVLYYPILSLSKGVRIKLAAGDTKIFLCGVVRLPGFEQGVIAQKTAYLLDSYITSPAFYHKYPKYTPPKGITANINHATVKSFSTEKTAFRFFLDKILPQANLITIMVDTYDFKNGLNLLIREMKSTPKLEAQKIMVALDSGNIEKQAFYAREKLDQAGLGKVTIEAMSNLDEYKIVKMVKNKVPIDLYVSVTEFLNITDAPSLEIVYKMAELQYLDGRIEHKAKLTKGKESYPGKKQIFRAFKNGKMEKDIIGLENEKLGIPLLRPVIIKGKKVKKIPNFDQTKVYLSDQIMQLPNYLKQITKNIPYPISVSEKIEKMLDKIKKKHLVK